MHIKIRADGVRLGFVIPNALLLNRLSAGIAARALSRVDGVQISSGDLMRLADELKRVKRRYGRLELVDIRSADGETVYITL